MVMTDTRIDASVPRRRASPAPVVDSRMDARLVLVEEMLQVGAVEEAEEMLRDEHWLLGGRPAKPSLIRRFLGRT